MKVILFLALLVASMLVIPTYGQTAPNNQLNYKMTPGKILENTDGILSVYATQGEEIIPINKKDVIVTSSDSSIMQIIGIEENQNNFEARIKIKAVGSGTVNIAIAAKGFPSKEVPITVYSNKYVGELLIRTTPSSFSVDGPKQGYVSVELSNIDGLPVIADRDIAVSLSSSDTNLVTLKNSDLVIKKGEYFAIGQFEANKGGEALIYASAQNMKTVSSTVTIAEPVEPLKIELFVYPETVNTISASQAYAIAVLEDADGNPVKSKESIPLSLKITDPTQEDVHTSDTDGYDGISSYEKFEIKKESYWAAVKLVTKAGLVGTYNVGISAKNYNVGDSKEITAVTADLLGDKSPVLDTVPILATGKEEIIGVMHLETQDSNPIAASRDLVLKIDSTNEDVLSLSNAKIDRGQSATLVFGQAGYFTTDDIILRFSESGNIATPTVHGPERDSLKLVAEPLISQIHANTEFPIIIYVTDETGMNTFFSDDSSVFVSPSEFLTVNSGHVVKGQSTILLNAKSLKAGDTTLSISTNDFTTSASMTSYLPKAATAYTNNPEIIYTNLDNSFSVQILDAQEIPVFADEDTTVTLVSSNPDIIDVPDNVIIKKGEYYALFEIDARSDGSAELSVLSSDIQLSKYNMKVKTMIPTITILSTDYINPNTPFDVIAHAEYLGAPLSDMKVDWNIQGAQIQDIASITDSNGNARVSLVSPDSGQISIQSSISGNGFSSGAISKQIGINLPLLSSSSSPANADTSTPSNSNFNLFGINPIFIILPVAIGVAGFILKKKHMLEGITEKIPIGRIVELKDKVIPSHQEK